jgi:Asp/Glu/hydantoin racemase
MPLKVAYLHTVLSVVPHFNDLSCELLPPETQVLHVCDEILAKVAVAQGRLSPFLYRRVAEHVRAAEEAGADVVQCTCSSISPCVDVAAEMVSIPVLKIDEAMVDAALTLGARIGVAATARTALEPTSNLVHVRAAALGKMVNVDTMLCEEAYPYLTAGDMATHDRIVLAGLLRLWQHNDVVILAQASMARVADAIPVEERLVPILSSPRLAIERLRGVLEELRSLQVAKT